MHFAISNGSRVQRQHSLSRFPSVASASNLEAYALVGDLAQPSSIKATYLLSPIWMLRFSTVTCVTPGCFAGHGQS